MLLSTLNSSIDMLYPRTNRALPHSSQLPRPPTPCSYLQFPALRIGAVSSSCRSASTSTPRCVTYALSLFAGTGGDRDPELANRILVDVLKDENAQDKLKGLSAAALGESARLGRGEALDVELAKARYEMAFSFGHREAAQTLALYWENRWGCTASGDSVPNRTIAQKWYKRCGENNQKILQTASPVAS